MQSLFQKIYQEQQCSHTLYSYTIYMLGNNWGKEIYVILPIGNISTYTYTTSKIKTKKVLNMY